MKARGTDAEVGYHALWALRRPSIDWRQSLLSYSFCSTLYSTLALMCPLPLLSRLISATRLAAGHPIVHDLVVV